MEYNLPLDKLYHWEDTTPEKVYLRQPIEGKWQTWTWKQTADEARRMAAALKAMEFPANSKIAMISKNCAHWIICDLAIMMSGHTSVPLYPNLNDTTIQQILEHSEAKMLFIGKLDDLSAVKTAAANGIKCISFPFCDVAGFETWGDAIKKHTPLTGKVTRNRNELATIIYTSGTTGMPKGVMHKFNSFGFVAENAIGYVGFKNSDRFFSYLPLAHIAERLLVETISLYVGGEVWFAETLATFGSNIGEAKPTIFLGVHRIWSKFQQGILAKMPQGRLDTLLKIPLISTIVKKKIRKGLGFSEATNIFTGAAPTPPALIKWFERAGIRLQEAYAMTENCCYSHVNLSNNIKVGFVGQPLPKCTVKLGDDKEILIKHDALMTGYYKEPELTKAAFTSDGFLKTGDEGYIDEEGFLKITGRVKDLFKTTKGKYVAPSPIEMKVAGNLNIEQVCIVGSGLPQPIALITLSEKGKKKPATSLEAELQEVISKLNISLDAHERLNKVVVIQEEWSVENGLLTPSFKIKRNEIERKYSSHYNQWFEKKDFLLKH